MRPLKALFALLLLAGPAAASTRDRVGPCVPGSTAPAGSPAATVITEGMSAVQQTAAGDCVSGGIPPVPRDAPAGLPQPPLDPLAPASSSLLAASYNPARPAPANFTSGQRVTRREYDDFDRITSGTVDLEDGGQATIRYTYWKNGLRKTATDAAGRVTFYEYNGRNLLSRVTVNQGLPDEQATTYEYWPDNLLKTIRRPNGTATAYVYDDADRVLSIVVTRGTARLASHEYEYDDNGNRTRQVEENGGPPETTRYEYDGLNRLKVVTYPGGRSVTYGYDAVGNRIAETERNAAGTVVSDKVAAFDAVNRLSTVTDAVDPAGSATFSYDRNGNLLTKTTAAGTQQHIYDVRDVLVETREGAAITARFAWDALGRRYLKIGAEGIRQYLYDQTSILEELDENDQEVAKYEYAADHLASFFRRDEPRRYFHLDALGSATALSDAGGDMVARYHLDAWGNFRSPTELDASRNRFAFTGYLWDQETDLYFAKARFYDPQFGRFTTQDSFLGRVDEPPSLHRYLYGNANPTTYIDPTGHASVFSARVEELAPYAEAAARGHEPRDVSGALALSPRRIEANARADASRNRRLKVQQDAAHSRLERLNALASGGVSHFAEITIDESDFKDGRLDPARIVAAVEADIGTYLGSEAFGVERAILERLAGAQSGERIDISELYSAGYAASASKALGVAALEGRPGSYGFLGAIYGQKGAAPRDLVTRAAESIFAGTVEDVGMALGGYAAVRGLAAATSEFASTMVSRRWTTGLQRESSAVDQALGLAPEGAGSQVERLAGSRLEHMNASVAEIHGYESLLGRGYQGIRGPGKTTAQGADSIAFDPTTREIVIQDAKYRGPPGRYPAKIPAEKLKRWGADIRQGIEDLPDGPLKDAARRAFEEGRIRPEVFRWPQ